MSRLDQLAIQSPCSADWAAMDGTETRRFCLSCNKAVHNLSAMAPCEAEALLARPGPAPCVRFLRRRDGSIVFDLARAAALAGVASLAACADVPFPLLSAPIEPPAPTWIPEATATPEAPPIPESTATPEAPPLPEVHAPLMGKPAMRPPARPPPAPVIEPTVQMMGGVAPSSFGRQTEVAPEPAPAVIEEPSVEEMKMGQAHVAGE
jgi:hypothetical protein